MLNNVKNIILKNKYAILVLLILSLWLRLARDYNILLSYLILMVLYVVMGIGVQIILERFFPNWIENEKKDDSNKESVNEPIKSEPKREAKYERRENSARVNSERNRNSFKRVDIDANEKPARSERSYTRSASRTADFSNRTEENFSDNKVSGYTRTERPNPAKPMPELRKTSPTPKVTSSYVRNAGGISYGMEKKLVRTSANFDEIRKESDHFSNAERQRERLYNASRSAIVGSERDLYKNQKKNETEEKNTQIQENPEEQRKEIPTERTAKFEKFSPTYDTYEEETENTYAETDLTKESEDLKNEVEKRIADSKRSTRRPIKVVDYDNTPYATYNEPVRRHNVHIPRADVTPKTSDINKRIVLGTQQEKPVNTRKVHVPTIETNDKVDADIDKINKLFDKDDNDEPKKGLFGRFKKKRR